jgi:ABC-2 type transport system permease protein
MSSVYVLTLRQLYGPWRVLIMAVLASLPVIIAVITLSNTGAPTVAFFELTILGTMLAGSIAPLVVLATAAAALGNELEDRTLANLTLSPLPRWQILLPKLLAVLTVSGPFIAASAFVTSYVAFMGDARATAAVTLSIIAAVVLYAAAFVWLGLVASQAIGIGLLYIVLWEGFLSQYVTGVRLLSIRHYAIALMHGLDERRFATMELLGTTVAVAISMAVFAAFTGLAVRRLRRMDVP